MYYRVAIQVDATQTWQWKSTVLSSLDTLFQFLRLFRAHSQDQLRVFTFSSREGLAEQLEQENNRLGSHSVTAAQYLHERMILPSAAVQSTSAREGEMPVKRGFITVMSQQAVNESGVGGSALENRSMSTLEWRREELESGPGGDHDLTYSFNLPYSVPQVLAWTAFLVKVRRGELQP